MQYETPNLQLISHLRTPQGEELKTNVRREGGLRNPSTGEYLELDIFIPALNIAFEFQVGLNTTYALANAKLAGKASLQQHIPRTHAPGTN